MIDDAAGIGDLLPDLECVGPKHGGDERKLFVLWQSHKGKTVRLRQEGAALLTGLLVTASSKKDS